MRKQLTLLHRYVGLAIALFLLIAGLTGAVIAFERELDAALNPDLFVTTTPGQSPLPLNRLVADVERDGRRRVAAVELPRPGQSVAMMRVESADPAKPLDHDQLFVDAATGTGLGQRLWGECCFGRRQLIPFLYRVHYTLLLPDRIGLWVIGIAALLWFADSFVGLALAVPRGRQTVAGWKRTLSVKRGAKGHRLHMDLHRAGGVWLWALLAVMAITAVSISLRDEIVKPVVTALSPLTPTIFDRPVPVAGVPASVSFGAAVDRAMAAARATMANPLPVYVAHWRDKAMFGVAMAEAGGDPRNGLGPSWFYVDDRDGRPRGTAIMGSGSGGDLFFQAQLPIHNGRIASLPGRILISLLGLLVAGLSATGIAIWWRKYRARAAQDGRLRRRSP